MSQVPDQKSELHTYYAEPFESSISSRNTPRAAYFSRRARILVVALAAVFSVWLHLAHGVDTPALPVPASDGTRCAPSTEFDWYALEPSTEIHWTPCYDGHSCARLLLPLDYTNASDTRTTAIALRLVPPASSSSSEPLSFKLENTVLVNPGGPGGSGTNFAGRAGANLTRVLGSKRAVLGFDPRGTGASTPRADCFASASQRGIWGAQEGERLLTLGRNASALDVGEVGGDEEGTLGLYLARAEVEGARCEAAIGGEGGIARFMSTASVARDMLEISERLGQDKLYYWGFSYGSVLGQYFAAMYPERVGRVVIDGVYDAHDYRAGSWQTNLADTEEVVSSLFDFCHRAGPRKCALYEPTPGAIRARYFDAVASVAEHPFPVPLADPPFVVTRKALLAQLFHASYTPLTAFSAVVDTVVALEARNASALAALAPKLAGEIPKCDCAGDAAAPWLASTEAFGAIACGDAEAVKYDPAAFAAYYDVLAAASPLAGPMWAVNQLTCTAWRVRPAWRHTGPLAAPATAHPLLVLQPRWDPVCPLSDARAVRARYGDAGILVQESYGHCTISAPSVCTAKHLRAYFSDEGTVPPEGTTCEADELPFVGSVTDVNALSVGDAELLEAMRGLADVLPADTVM